MSPPRPTRPPGSQSLMPDPAASSAGAIRTERTPPPAPSASYASRVRGVVDDPATSAKAAVVTMGPPPVSYVPLNGGDEEERSSDGGSSLGGGYRRARAGTMPSKLAEVASRYTVPEDEPPMPVTTGNSPPHLVHPRTSALSPAYPQTSPSRPILRHTNSSAAELESPSSQRHRSGSLTLPNSGLGAAFGSSAFSNAWLANPGLTTSSYKSPLGQSDAAPSEGHSQDDLQFSTLDYLGLADTSSDTLPPASVSELRNQAARAIASNGPASRLRANTVSNFARQQYRPSITNPNIYARDLQSSQFDLLQTEEALHQAIEQLGIYDQPHLSGFYPQFRDSNRPRATTIGALDNLGRRQGGFLASIPQSPDQGHLLNPMGGYGYPLRSRESSRGPRMSVSSHTSRTGTPDHERGSSTPQVPTRSLWIGNLDVNATSEALLRVFTPYGAIESVRMLPEKTCAFVNFLDRTDAIRARDDVLNRLGGHVHILSETAPVRIGFGKIDSAPGATVSANGSSAPTPAPPSTVPNLSTLSNLAYSSLPNGGIGSVTVPPQVPSTQSTPERDSEHSAMPTRALWIGSIPGTTSSATLLQVFSPFGPVESARVLQHKVSDIDLGDYKTNKQCCGFINFERLDSAVSARNALNGRDILGSDVGPIRIGFARVPTKTPTIGGPVEEMSSSSPEKLGEGLNTVKGATSVSTEQQLSVEGGGVENFRSPLVIDLVKAGVHEQVLEKGLAKGGVVSDQQMIMQVLSQGREEDGDVKAAADTRAPATYYTAIPLITDRPQRRFDSTRLKELRKRLDTGMCADEEINGLGVELLEDCAELASDYIGNTVIQKLFERVEPTLRFAMLERIAPHLAMIGIHKNGTWAAQKVIECSVTNEERILITSHLRPFAPPLMCDSLGNYVCAGTLRFGAPHNDYVFDAMIDRMWDIAQNRFGARCMRTCLESPNTTLYQKKRIASSIILNAIPLSTNPNGALLLTWLVDTSNLPGRYGLLANRFAPHIAHLCTHKLASLTVLRIISQSSDASAATTLTSAIFDSPSDQTLVEILTDANNGAQVVGKILATTTLSNEERDKMVEAVRRVLPTIKASTTPPYRLLLEAVGLPVPSGGGGGGAYARGPGGAQAQQQQAWTQGNAGYMGGYYPYQQPSGMMGYPTNGGGGLAPLAIPPGGGGGGMNAMGRLSPNLPQQGGGGRGSPKTPQPGAGQIHGLGRRGKNSPVGMMSPGSDPFNPFASPSVDGPFNPSPGGMRLASQLGRQMTFEEQPNIGGLGIPGMYYQQNMGMYAGGGNYQQS